MLISEAGSGTYFLYLMNLAMDFKTWLSARQLSAVAINQLQLERFDLQAANRFS